MPRILITLVLTLILLPACGSDSGSSSQVAACAELVEEEGAEGLPFKVMLDPGLKVVEGFGLKGKLSLPATFVLDAAGSLRYVYVGSNPGDRPAIKRILEEVRALAEE